MNVSLHLGSAGTRCSVRPQARRRPGASLLEMSFVLFIMIMMVVGAAVLMGMMASDLRGRQEATAIDLLADSVRRIKKFDGYPMDNTLVEEVIELKLVPTRIYLEKTTKKLKNQWGGDIHIIGQDSGANFAISYTNVPDIECRRIVNSVSDEPLHSVGPGLASSSSGGGGVRRINQLRFEDLADICASGTIHFSTANLGS